MCIKSYLIKTLSEYVGNDVFGNKYYQKNDRRYVVYKGIQEPSKVPPMWHAWLHHLIDEKPSYEQLEKHRWQKKHQPNLTGTKNSYSPSRKEVSSDYKSWRPNG